MSRRDVHDVIFVGVGALCLVVAIILGFAFRERPVAGHAVPASTVVAAPTNALPPTDRFLADIHAAGLPDIVNDAYTQASAAQAPCTVAAEGLSWSDILLLDEQLPVGPSEYGRMAAIGIRDECPRYLSVVPSGWLP